MMRILPLVFHGDIGKRIDDASADPDRNRTETEFVEPLPACRQRIFPHQHAAVITSTRSGRPISSMTCRFVIGTDRLSSFDSDLTMVYATPQPKNKVGTISARMKVQEPVNRNHASSSGCDIAWRVALRTHRRNGCIPRL